VLERPFARSDRGQSRRSLSEETVSGELCRLSFEVNLQDGLVYRGSKGSAPVRHQQNSHRQHKGRSVCDGRLRRSLRQSIARFPVLT
jgi:hypothetical protein